MDMPAVNTRFPNQAQPALVQLLLEIYRSRYHQDLQQTPEALERVQESAQELRNLLEIHNRVPVKLNDLAGHDFHTMIHRAELRAWLSLTQNNHYAYSVPPRSCPLCAQPMMGQWHCFSCGLELESPEQRERKGQATEPDTAFLPYFHVLLTDPERQRVLVVNVQDNHRVVWEISQNQWDLQPWQAFMLNHQRLLVVDKAAGRLVECSLFGEVLWEWDRSLSPDHMLREPVKAVPFEHEGQQAILLVDQGHHRVMAINRSQEILWQFGTRALPGKEHALNHPSDAQLTPDGTLLIADTGNARVIEIKLSTGVIFWESPEHLGLQQPVSARRLDSQRMRLVDIGLEQILELNAAAEVAQSCRYTPVGKDKAPLLNGFTQAFYRENQRLLVADQQQVLEIDVLQKHLLWQAPLSSLNFEYHDQLFEALSGNEAFFKRVYRAFYPKVFQLDEVLKEVGVFAGAPEAFYAEIKPLLTQHEYAEQQWVIHQGEAGSEMFIVKAGQLEVLLEPDQHLATLEMGDVFGEIAILSSTVRNASVRTLGPATLLRLSKAAFQTVAQRYPEIREKLARLASSRERVNAIRHERVLKLEHASEKLKGLIQAQWEKVKQIEAGVRHDVQEVIPYKPSWRLRYSPVEQHVIHTAWRQHLRVYEIHLEVYHDWPGIESVSLLMDILDSHSTVIRVFPDVETILMGQLQHKALHDTLVLTVISPLGKAELIEEMMTFEWVRRASLFTVFY